MEFLQQAQGPRFQEMYLTLYLSSTFFRCLTEHAYKDVCFTVHGINFFVHRLILSVRSPYFAHMFTTKWKERSNIRINNHKVQIRYDIFVQVLVGRIFGKFGQKSSSQTYFSVIRQIKFCENLLYEWAICAKSVPSRPKSFK